MLRYLNTSPAIQGHDEHDALSLRSGFTTPTTLVSPINSSCSSCTRREATGVVFFVSLYSTHLVIICALKYFPHVFNSPISFFIERPSGVSEYSMVTGMLSYTFRAIILFSSNAFSSWESIFGDI